MEVINVRFTHLDAIAAHLPVMDSLFPTKEHIPVDRRTKGTKDPQMARLDYKNPNR